MLKETAPTVSIVCNTSKIQVALFRWVVKEGQAHRHRGAACILGIGEIRGADAPLPHSGVFGKGKREEGKGLIVPGKTKFVEVEAGARTLEGVDTFCTANSSTTIIHSHQLLPSNWKSSYSFTCCRKNGIRDCRKSRSQSSICTGGFEFTINNGYVYFGSVL